MALQLIPEAQPFVMGRSLVRRSLFTAFATLSALGVALDSAIASANWQAEPLRGISQMPVRVMKLCRLCSREDQLQAAVVQPE